MSFERKHSEMGGVDGNSNMRRGWFNGRNVALAVLAAAIPAGVVMICGAAAAGAAGAGAAATPEETYTTTVKPIFQQNCYGCHGNGPRFRGGLDLSTKAGMMKGGRDGVVIVAGDPANSLLVKLIKNEGPEGGPKVMPPMGDKLSDADIATITQWIKDGAAMPDDPPKAVDPPPPAAN